MTAQTQTATFAAGCFWGVEELFRKLPGVLSTRVGYTGGSKPNPTYEEVCTDTTGHAEAIEITFDPAQISYLDLLGYFFANHNPTTLNRQGPDAGTQYRSAIFYHSDEQKQLATQIKTSLDTSGEFKDPIVTEILPATSFYPAEEYHQKYLKKRGKDSCGI